MPWEVSMTTKTLWTALALVATMLPPVSALAQDEARYQKIIDKLGIRR